MVLHIFNVPYVYVYRHIHLCVSISLPPDAPPFRTPVPLRILSYSSLPELPSSSLLALAKSDLFLKTQCWVFEEMLEVFSLTPKFCASTDGLKLGEVPDTMSNTFQVLDLNTDLYWLMAQD